VSAERRIARNVGALALARGVTAVLSLVTFAYLARVLEPAAFGVLGVGLSLLAYFGLPINLGLSVLGTRALAREPARATALAGGIVGLRLALLALGLGGYLVAVLLFALPFPYRVALAVQGFTLVGQAIAVDWVYQGVERMGALALRNVIVAVLTLGGALLLVRGPDDVVWAAAVTMLAVVAANGWLLFTFRRDFGPLQLRGHRSAWGGWIRQGLPLLTTLFMVTVYTHTDTLMVGAMRGEAEAGLYTAAFKVMMAAIIPLDVLLQAFMPALSNALGDLRLMRVRGEAFARTLLIVGIPLTLGSALHAGSLMELFYGADYRTGALVLSLLMGAALFHYLNTALGNPLIAWDRERWYMMALVLGAGVNVILNLVLVPLYGGAGAAAATMACQGSVLLVLGVMHYRVIGQLYVGVLLRVLPAAVVAVGAPFFVGRHWGWPFTVVVVVSVALYAGCVLLVRAVNVPSLLREIRGVPSRA
jgi:O-antigen/teichoic acid export membrane protein